MKKYIIKINNITNSNDMKQLVKDLYYDRNINDNVFDIIIYDYVIPKLEKIGICFETDSYENVLLEQY